VTPVNPPKSRVSVPMDPRFLSTQDKSKHCWGLYNEFLACGKAKSEANAECKKLGIYARQVCPADWMSVFTDSRERHVWFGLPSAHREESPDLHDVASHPPMLPSGPPEFAPPRNLGKGHHGSGDDAHGHDDHSHGSHH